MKKITLSKSLILATFLFLILSSCSNSVNSNSDMPMHMDHSKMDHSKMNMPKNMNHSNINMPMNLDHSKMDHSKMDQPNIKPHLKDKMGKSSMPKSGKAREQGYKNSNYMDSTTITNDLKTKCNQAKQGLIMMPNSELKNC